MGKSATGIDTAARRRTRVVHVGDVTVGGSHPIRVQSMTTPSTRDTTATVDQIERLVDAGCEIVRLTVPTGKDADNLPSIRAELRRRRIRVPLVADIHFTPAAAMRAVEHVEKIRINPGNYADKKRFAVRGYDDAEYEAELTRIAEVFSPLALRAKQLGVSMRIGTNHGSLSDRIMNRYGDTPEGMVESALEFVRICRERDYHELVLSMKSSNPIVVLEVYRLLSQRMALEQMDYPFHLGVTEAGDGEDARIKSAIGIGALLEEGLGDTVRVSLTEDPVAEIPVALALVAPHNARHAGRGPIPAATAAPARFDRRVSTAVAIGPRTIGGGSPVLVELPLTEGLDRPDELRREIDSHTGARVPEDTRAELVSVRVASTDDLDRLVALRRSVELVAPTVALSARTASNWLLDADDDSLDRWIRAAHRLHLPVGPTEVARVAAWDRLLQRCDQAGVAVLAEVRTDDDEDTALDAALTLARGRGGQPLMLALAPDPRHSLLLSVERLGRRLAEERIEVPLVLVDRPATRGADPLLGPSTALGGALCAGLGDSVHIELDNSAASRRLTFGVLQAARIRITRTEFISCPSCGRTLFDLEETTARIKLRTAHLKGVKIAVMGCVVNGPGEMADADFGYVGWGENKIALFVGKEMVARDIPTIEADDRLVDLIKQHGRWVDPPPACDD